MRFILDFDHTLFDTNAFSVAAEPYKATGLWVTPQIWDELDARTFLYSDTLDFLNAKQTHELIILSAWTPSLGAESHAFQVSKIDKSGIADLVDKVVVMEGDKGPQVKLLCGGAPTVFVDDRIDHLLATQAMCPEVTVVQMVRPEVGMLLGDPSVPVVSSLAELDVLVSRCT